MLGIFIDVFLSPLKTNYDELTAQRATMSAMMLLVDVTIPFNRFHLGDFSFNNQLGINTDSNANVQSNTKILTCIPADQKE